MAHHASAMLAAGGHVVHCAIVHRCDALCSLLPGAAAPAQQAMWPPAMSSGTGAMHCEASCCEWLQVAAEEFG